MEMPAWARIRDRLRAGRSRERPLVLTVYIVKATDRHFTVGIAELPAVRAAARNIDAIPDATRAAAAEHTGIDPKLFTIVNDY